MTSHVPPPPLAAQFCMIMPKAAGNLSGAIEGKGLTGKMKVEIAALLLHAVAWLASHQVMHRHHPNPHPHPNQAGQPSPYPDQARQP